MGGMVSRRYRHYKVCSIHSKAIEGSRDTITRLACAKIEREITNFSGLLQWLSSIQGCRPVCWILSRPRTSDVVLSGLEGRLQDTRKFKYTVDPA